MPIIEESMMDTNVGAAQVPNADVGVGQGLQTFGNTLSEILLDMNARRTETETKNYFRGLWACFFYARRATLSNYKK